MEKPSKIAPAKGKLGVLLPGLGAVSTTFMAGVELVRKGKAQPVEVQAGITDGSKTEVIAGALNENDPVIIGMSGGATQGQSGVANPFQAQVPRPGGGFGFR